MKKRNRLVALFSALVLIISTLSVPVFAASANEDVVGTDCEVAVGKLKAVGVMAGYPDGSFKPEGNITRAEFAKIAVEALGLSEAAKASEGATKFPDVAGSKWYSGYVNVAANRGLIGGYPDGTFKPNGYLTNAEAITILVRLIGLGPVVDKEGTWPANYIGRAANEGLLDDVYVAGVETATRGNVAMMLSNSLTVEMWGADGYEDDGSVVYGKINETLLGDRLEVKEVEDARVTDYDTDDNELTIAGEGTLEVAEGVDVDLYDAYLNEVTVWINDDDEVIFADVTSDFFIDAIEINDDGDEVTLIGADKDYDLDLDDTYLNGKSDNLTTGTKYDLAKVVLNDKNDVVYIDAYEFTEFVVVKDTDGDVVTDLEDEELDLEDYTIFKDGKLVDVADMVEGDILLLRSSDEFAEVYTNAVTGAIDKVYDQAIKVDGEEYDVDNGLVADVETMYVDEDDDFVQFYDGDNDAAEQMEDAGEDVTLYLDREGEVLFITGELGEVATSTMAVVLSEDAEVDPSFGKYSLQLEFVNENGKDVTETVKLRDLDKITVLGTEYEVDEGDIDHFDSDDGVNLDSYDETGIEDADIIAVADLAKGTVVELTYDVDGDVVGFETFQSMDFTADLDVEEANYVEGYKILSDTVVFNIEDGIGEDDTTVAEWDDITEFDTIKWDHDGSDDDDATVYYNDDEEALYIVARATDAEEDVTDFVALVTDFKENTDNDVIKLTAWVDGKEKDYVVDEFPGVVNEGDIYVLEVQDEDGLVTDITTVAGEGLDAETDEDLDASSVDVSDKKFTVDGAEYTLVSDGFILDYTDSDDVEVKSVRDLKDLEAGNLVDVVLDDDSNTKYAKLVVIRNDGTAAVAPPAPSASTTYFINAYHQGFDRLTLEDAKANIVNMLVADFAAVYINGAELTTAEMNTWLDLKTFPADSVFVEVADDELDVLVTPAATATVAVSADYHAGATIDISNATVVLDDTNGDAITGLTVGEFTITPVSLTNDADVTVVPGPNDDGDETVDVAADGNVTFGGTMADGDATTFDITLTDGSGNNITVTVTATDN